MVARSEADVQSSCWGCGWSPLGSGTAREHQAASVRDSGSAITTRSGPRALSAPYCERVRWEALFADMEAQLDAASAADLAAEVADLTRAERATVGLADRLRAARGAELTVLVGGAGAGSGGASTAVSGELLEVAAQWLLLGVAGRRALVPLAVVVAVRGVPLRVAPAPGEVARRLGLGSALRALARDRAHVHLSLEGTELVGRIERVGADHLDLATAVEAPLGAGTIWSVPFAALRVVRSA